MAQGGRKLTTSTLPQNVKNAIDLLNYADESGINSEFLGVCRRQAGDPVLKLGALVPILLASEPGALARPH
jgi:hypothetical protein